MYSGDKLESKNFKQAQNENDVILTLREKSSQFFVQISSNYYELSLLTD